MERSQSPRNQKMFIFKCANKQNELLGKRVKLPKASKKKNYGQKVETKDHNTWLKWDQGIRVNWGGGGAES